MAKTDALMGAKARITTLEKNLAGKEQDLQDALSNYEQCQMSLDVLRSSNSALTLSVSELEQAAGRAQEQFTREVESMKKASLTLRHRNAELEAQLAGAVRDRESAEREMDFWKQEAKDKGDGYVKRGIEIIELDSKVNNLRVITGVAVVAALAAVSTLIGVMS